MSTAKGRARGRAPGPESRMVCWLLFAEECPHEGGQHGSAEDRCDERDAQCREIRSDGDKRCRCGCRAFEEQKHDRPDDACRDAGEQCELETQAQQGTQGAAR
ncbi:hypothetical protein LBMAG57_17800 [Verrucomicrobiota bacterium]|nr:hypothetical protein LBMAG57_17800 [Verrucomicrobiota bacterium]